MSSKVISIFVPFGRANYFDGIVLNSAYLPVINGSKESSIWYDNERET